MRRIIHNTTAIAACLSLLSPQLAMAQTVLSAPPAPATGKFVLAQAETAPEGDAVIPPEGTSEAPAAEAEGEAAAEAEAEVEAEAEASAEEPSEAAVSDLEAALAAEEAAQADADTQAPDAGTSDGAPASPEPMTEAEAEAQPQAEQPKAEAEAEAEIEAEAQADTAPEPQADAEPAPQPAMEPEAQEPAAQTQGDPQPAAQPDAAAQAQTAAPAAEAPPAEGSGIDALTNALRAQGQAEQSVEEPAPEASADTGTPAANGALRVAGGDTQTTRAGNMPGLANVLQQEVDGGLTAESLTCLTGGTFPCADGDRAMTPRGVVVETNSAGELRLAPAEAQMYRVTQSGELVRRAAEEDTRETEAAREAAQADTPSTAAALDAAEGSGEVTETQVTEESRRSSSEDFATNLRDALAGSTGQQAEAQEDDDDNNNLRNALLLGLGAVAVGSYLNNNRQVALSAPDRVVVTRADGSQEVIKDEVALLRQPGSTVATENFDDGSSRTIVTREDGSRVVTIRDANLRVLRRTLVSADGTTTRLIDDTTDVQPVDVSELPAPAPVQTSSGPLDEAELRAALQRETQTDRRFTLSQIRNIPEVRALVAPVNIDAITFDTGSAAIRPDQAQALQSLGTVIQEQISSNPSEIFMIEGHTDTVGSDPANLALSDRRAESVALALAEYFDVPPENLVTQGYGEQFLRIRAQGDIRDNRRASVRRITDLLSQ